MPVRCPHCRGWLLWHFPSPKQGQMTEHKAMGSKDVYWCPPSHLPSVSEEGTVDIVTNTAHGRGTNGEVGFCGAFLVAGGSVLALPLCPYRVCGALCREAHITTEEWGPHMTHPQLQLHVCHNKINLAFRASQLWSLSPLQTKHKLIEILNHLCWVWWHVPVIPALWETEVEESQVQALPGQRSNLMRACLKF